MSQLQIIPVLCRAGKMDNYSYLITDADTKDSAIIDPSEATPIINTCTKLQIRPKYILNTHHHFDHTDANIELKKLYQAQVVGNKQDAYRIPGIDISVTPDTCFCLGQSRAEIIEADGHTKGHILWYFPDSKALFTGDVLFNLSIGGLFEGNIEEMFTSLQKIKKLPDDVLFYPGHEYTIHGLSLAKYLKNDKDFKEYLKITENRLNQSLPVAPINLGLEKSVNPYLHANTLEELNKIFNL